SAYYFCLTAPTTTLIYTLSLHDALPIFCINKLARLIRSLVKNRNTVIPYSCLNPDFNLYSLVPNWLANVLKFGKGCSRFCKICRSEEHTSELQSRENLVCRLLLEKKKKS